MTNAKSMHPSHCLVACDMTSCTCQPKRHEVEKPKAIDLAEWLESTSHGSISAVAAAAELRRLHGANVKLLEALKDMERTAGHASLYDDPVRIKVRAAIAKARQS